MIEFYASKMLGALGSDLAAISWFFSRPFESPNATLQEKNRSWVLGEAASRLKAQGRFAEALRADRAGLELDEVAMDWQNAAITAHNLSEAELITGECAWARQVSAISAASSSRMP